MIRLFSRRESLTAERLNELVAALNALMKVNAGPGLEGRLDPKAGLLLRLVGGMNSRGVLCKITAVHGGPVDYPSRITYDYQGIGVAGVTGTGVTPKYGRQVTNDECMVYAAGSGDLCWVWRKPNDDGTVTAELELFREDVARGPC